MARPQLVTLDREDHGKAPAAHISLAEYQVKDREKHSDPGPVGRFLGGVQQLLRRFLGYCLRAVITSGIILVVIVTIFAATYLANGFGYHYLSSEFKNSESIDLGLIGSLLASFVVGIVFPYKFERELYILRLLGRRIHFGMQIKFKYTDDAFYVDANDESMTCVFKKSQVYYIDDPSPTARGYKGTEGVRLIIKGASQDFSFIKMGGQFFEEREGTAEDAKSRRDHFLEGLQPWPTN